MADFQTDVQSIKVMVNEATSKEAAVELFYSMEGIDMEKEAAESVLLEAIAKKFGGSEDKPQEKSATLSMIETLENKLK